MPDERGDSLVPGAIHVPMRGFGVALDPIPRRPQPLDRIEAATPVVLTPRRSKRLGGGHELLIPFLERGSTASPVPIVSAGEVMAAPTLISLDPARPIGAEVLEAARALAAQAVLAIGNARLYEQQVHFADAMQRPPCRTSRRTWPVSRSAACTSPRPA